MVRGCLFKTKFYPVDLDAHAIYALPYTRERDLAWAWRARGSVIGMPGSRLEHRAYDVYRIVPIKSPADVLNPEASDPALVKQKKRPRSTTSPNP